MTIAPLSADTLGEARALLRASCAYDDAAAVAEEKLFGAVPAPHESVCLGARHDGELVGVAVISGRWLRLLAVTPAARGRGVGGALLDAACQRAQTWGATRVRTGDQPGNYLSPGIDERNVATITFLEKRGFVEKTRYENLSVPLVGNEKISAARAQLLALAARGYKIRRARRDDGPALEAFATAAFAAAWAFEIARGLELDPPGVHIALDKAGQIVAFACHDANNRGLGWFGPAGTAAAERGKGLGAALLLPCLLDVAAAGHDEGVIAWIGPRHFYEQIAGARSGRRFIVLEKSLT